MAGFARSWLFGEAGEDPNGPLISLLDLTFASERDGIDNPFIALVARFLIVCAGTR